MITVPVFDATPEKIGAASVTDIAAAGAGKVALAAELNIGFDTEKSTFDLGCGISAAALTAKTGPCML